MSSRGEELISSGIRVSGGFRGSTGESMVVDHVMKGMFVVTFEIGVKLGVVSVRGRMVADPKHTHATL